jgi:hypothetical protein
MSAAAYPLACTMCSIRVVSPTVSLFSLQTARIWLTMELDCGLPKSHECFDGLAGCLAIACV